MILTLGCINYLGVRFGGDVQVVFTAVKVGLIAFMILAGLFYRSSGSPVPPLRSTPRPPLAIRRLYRRAGGRALGL